MSPELKQFYIEMKKIANGDVGPYWFRKGNGLCNNLKQWAKANSLHNKIPALEHELEAQFVAAGLDDTYPFNDGSSDLYNNDDINNTMYKNSDRVQWINKHAAPYSVGDRVELVDYVVCDLNGAVGTIIKVSYSGNLFEVKFDNVIEMDDGPVSMVSVYEEEIEIVKRDNAVDNSFAWFYTA